MVQLRLYYLIKSFSPDYVHAFHSLSVPYLRYHSFLKQFSFPFSIFHFIYFTCRVNILNIFQGSSCFTFSPLIYNLFFFASTILTLKKFFFSFKEKKCERKITPGNDLNFLVNYQAKNEKKFITLPTIHFLLK